MKDWNDPNWKSRLSSLSHFSFTVAHSPLFNLLKLHSVSLYPVCHIVPGGTASWSWSSRRKISWTRCYACRTTCWSVPRSSPRSRTREKPSTPLSTWEVTWEESWLCRDACPPWREPCLSWSPNYSIYRYGIMGKYIYCRNVKLRLESIRHGDRQKPCGLLFL